MPDEIFQKSSQCMAIFDSQSQTLREVNGAMKKRLGTCTTNNIEIKIVVETATDIYGTLQGIPCHMRTLSTLDSHVYVVEVFAAHTKTWSQESDIVKLTDLTSDGVWEWFPTLDFEYMSQRFWSILGYSQENMEESPRAWMDFIDQDDKKECLRMYETHVQNRGDGSPYHATVRYRHSEGHQVYILCRGTVVDWMPDGRPWRLLGTHTDVTDIVKKDAVKAQSDFISRMSHEIRSPICTILNECELLAGKNTNVITQTCQQLISLTDDILSLGKTKQQAGTDLKQEPGDLSDIFSNCRKRHVGAAKKKEIRIKLSVGDFPELVLIDVVKYNQVLDNLLNNSIKYSDAGVITIDVDYDFENCLCEVRVQDEGQGILPAFQSRVFEEFVQGDDTMQGAGIGLYLSRYLARTMHGDVVIEKSEERVGTTMLFTSILPLVDRNDAVRNDFNVMVVDDMEVNRLILMRRLACCESIGLKLATIVEAVDGRDAFTKFAESKGDIQLILMDCLMPVMDGFEATTLIHDECARLGIEPVPVVAVTASVSSDVHEKCSKHGIKFVVTKPYTEQDLILSIQSCVKSKPHQV